MSAPAQVLVNTARILQGKLFRKGTQKRARAEQNLRDLAASIIGFKAA